MGYKIIELEIDDNILSGQTGVETVALVEEPAIDTEFIFFGRQKFYKAPDYVSQKACQAIKENEERGNPAGTQVGKVRAQQLCNQSEISLETIKRMKSFLERAATYNTGNWDDNGTIAYGLWGGEEALKWVDTVLSQLENQEMEIDVSGLPPYVNYPTGDTKNDMLIKPVLFVEKVPGESKNDYLQRCIPVLRQEGYPEDQAVAICISEYQNYTKCGNCSQKMQTEFNLDVYGYLTKFFHICPGAQSTFKELISFPNTEDSIGMIRSAAVVADSIFEIEDKVLRNKKATIQDVKQATVLVDDFKDIISEVEKIQNKKYDISYMDGHIQTIQSYLNKEFDITPNPCWEGYEPYGLKPDGSPNCIPIDNSKQEFSLLGYMDGIPYFSTPEEAIQYGEENYDCDGYHVHTDENGNEVYMSCASHDELPDGGVELESLLAQGWVIEDINEVNTEELLKTVKQKYSKVTEEEFYRIVSDPNENSIIDFAGSKIRYVYVSGMGADLIRTSREFCKRMLGGKQYVFRYEDIMRLNAQITSEDVERTIIPRPVGTQPDIMLYKGGANCRHYWLELIFGNMTPNVGYEEPITNRKYDEIRKAVINTPATGQAGIVNPKANPQKGSRDAFNKGVNRTIIVDVDDTLFDGFTPKEDVIDYVNSKWGGHRISIVSARNSARLIETQTQLIRAGVRFDDIFLVNAPANKAKKVKELMNNGFRIVEVIENNPMTQQDYRNLGILKVSSPDKFNKLIPTGFIQGLPIFEDKVMAQDYSYKNGCGGIVEPVTYLGKQMYQSCTYNSKKEENFNKVNFSSNEEKRMVYGPLMLPGVLIPRIDENTGEKYFVKFKPETIEKIQRKFMIEGRLRNTNYEHDDNKKFNDAVLVENWIVTSENDKIYDMGFNQLQIPIGSWVGGYYILDTKEGNKIWEMIKDGTIRGFSVEGDFMLKFHKQVFQKNEDDILLEEIINILSSIED